MLDWVFISDVVEVRGISDEGKNRINEHGSIWKIVKVVNDAPLGIMPIGSVLMESTKDQYTRWIKPNDEHLDMIRLINLDNV